MAPPSPVSFLDALRGFFRINVESVYRLMNFDRVVIDFAVQNVESLHERLKKTSAADRPWLNAEHTVAALRKGASE
jgi:hypothetical protein